MCAYEHKYEGEGGQVTLFFYVLYLQDLTV